MEVHSQTLERVSDYLTAKSNLKDLKNDLRTKENIESFIQASEQFLEAKSRVARFLRPENDRYPIGIQAQPRTEIWWNTVYVGLFSTSMAFFAMGFGLI